MTPDATIPRRALSPRAAVATVFFVFGTTVGLWGGSVAEVARLAVVEPGVIGSAFVGYNIAGILGMAVSGRVGRSISLKVRLLGLLALTAICMALLFHVSSAPELIVGLFVFSFLASSVDLVMNSEGIAVERDLGRPVLAGFHGVASLGVAAGAISGSYLSVRFGVTATAFVSLCIFAFGIATVAMATPDRGATHDSRHGSTWFRPGPALLALSLIIGASIASEIASVMFSAQTLASQAPELAAYAGAGATAFALFQAAVRLRGDRLRAMFGDAMLIRISLATALVGLTLVSVSTSFVASAIGFAIVGIGTACIVPCGFAMAAAMSAMPAAAVISMVAIITGAFRIPAPLAYGFLAEESGFAPAFAVYAVLMAAALAGALFVMARTRIRRPA
jgi:hypothetical protein